MVDPHIDPALVPSQVVYPIGNGFALSGNQKVMDPHSPRLAHCAPLPPRILEVSDQFLLLGIHGNHRLSIGLVPAHFAVDELKLGIAVRVLPTFLGFLVRL